MQAFTDSEFTVQGYREQNLSSLLYHGPGELNSGKNAMPQSPKISSKRPVFIASNP
jgi:hypothetical protein